jgi:hypothetical protein
MDALTTEQQTHQHIEPELGPRRCSEALTLLTQALGERPAFTHHNAAQSVICSTTVRIQNQLQTVTGQHIIAMELYIKKLGAAYS